MAGDRASLPLLGNVLPLGEAKPGEDLSKTLPVNPCCSDLVEEGTETW